METINYTDTLERQYRRGQKNILNRVKKYLLERMVEWNELGDRKYDLPNIQVYNSVRSSLDALEDLGSDLGDYKEEPSAWWVGNNLCSNCRKHLDGYAYQRGYLYCPFCGARMD